MRYAPFLLCPYLAYRAITESPVATPNACAVRGKILLKITPAFLPLLYSFFIPFLLSLSLTLLHSPLSTEAYSGNRHSGGIDTNTRTIIFPIFPWLSTAFLPGAKRQAIHFTFTQHLGHKLIYSCDSSERDGATGRKAPSSSRAMGSAHGGKNPAKIGRFGTSGDSSFKNILLSYNHGGYK